MSMAVRLFLAINLSRPMKDALVAAQNTMYDHGVRGNYTPEENLHLTLAFIGDYPKPETVLDALATVSFFPIPITLDGLGAFGDLWWAGLREAPALTAVVRRVRRALADNDIPFDRKRFSPHITLYAGYHNRAVFHGGRYHIAHALGAREKRHDLHRAWRDHGRSVSIGHDDEPRAEGKCDRKNIPLDIASRGKDPKVF